jgi:hypothetical protein
MTIGWSAVRTSNDTRFIAPSSASVSVIVPMV